MEKKEGKEEDRQQGLLLASIGNIRGGAYFRGKDEGEGREKGKKRVLLFLYFSLFYGDFMEIFGIWERMRGGKEGKEEDLMRMNPKRP